MMIQSVWKNLTGLQKDKSWSQLNTSGVTLNEPKTHHQTLMTYIWKKALPNCGNKDGNIIHVLKNVISTSVATLWSVWNDCTHMYKSLVFGDEFLAQGLHLKSHRGVQLGLGLVFLQTRQVLPHWLNHHSSLILSYTQRHCHVRIEKGSVQTVAIKLEAHNSLEYHYMLKH